MKGSTRTALSFDPSSLLDERFDADRLTEDLRLRVPLETLRADLATHLEELQATLVDLINRDYNDLVSMSTSLVGIDDKIDRLGQPIEHLRQQFEGSRDDAAECLASLRSLTAQRDEISRHRAQLQMFVQIADSLSNIGRLWAAEADVGTARRPHESSLERIAGEISVLSATCDRAPQECAFIKQSRAQLDKEQARLLHEACAVLRRGIGEREQGAVESSLRAFAAVGQEVVAHRLFREEFASPAVADAVDAAKRDDGALAVEQVYAAVDEFLARESTCCLLGAAAGLRSSSAPHAAGEAAGYDFVANSLWTEVYDATKRASPGCSLSPPRFLCPVHFSVSFARATTPVDRPNTLRCRAQAEFSGRPQTTSAGTTNSLWRLSSGLSPLTDLGRHFVASESTPPRSALTTSGSCTRKRTSSCTKTRWSSRWRRC